MAQKGNIGVTTENIFPVIKKFLYSDHEIFLREMVSNAVDATQKLKTLYRKCLPYMQEYRKLAPNEKAKWGVPLYTIYLNLNMGREFEEIDKLLKK